MSSTHIRIPEEVKRKLDNLSQNGESVGSVIARLISYYENAGTVNNEVNTPVNSSPADLEALVNNAVNDKLTDMQGQVNTIVNSKLTQINERLDNLIPGIEHQRDETGHTLEMVFSIQKRLEALEALPVTIPAHTPDDKPEENTRGDEHDQGQEQDEVSEERKKIIDRIKYLNKECKISYAKIAIGIGLKDTDKGRISEAINPKIRCPLTKEQIEKLFLIEKSSPEGT